VTVSLSEYLTRTGVNDADGLVLASCRKKRTGSEKERGWNEREREREREVKVAQAESNDFDWAFHLIVPFFQDILYGLGKKKFISEIA
jgi:hypothetical protein